MRLVAEMGHVEHPGGDSSSSSRGVEENLFLEKRDSFDEEAVDQRQGLESDDPVARFPQTPRNGGYAGEDVAAGEGSQV